MSQFTEAFEKAKELRDRERRFLQGYGDHGLTMGQVEALRARMERKAGFPLYAARVNGRTRIVSIPD